MNIHKSQLFWGELQGYKVLTHCHISWYIIGLPTPPWYPHDISYGWLYIISPNLGATFDLQKTEEMPSSSVKQYGHLIMSLPRLGERWAKRCWDLFHIIKKLVCHHFHITYIYISFILAFTLGMSSFYIIFTLYIIILVCHFLAYFFMWKMMT